MTSRQRAAGTVVVGLAVALWLLGFRLEHAAGWAILVAVAAGALWSVLFVDWEPAKEQGRGQPR